MVDNGDVRSFNQIKAYPRGSAQGGSAIQAVKGSMSENDGASSHRTVIRETAEGRAIARTRDGMPMVEVEKFESGLYMETGHLQFTYPAPEAPTKLDPAKWRFMDIAPAGDWLGEINVEDGTQVVSQPTPIGTGILADNIDSLAIGYERSNDAAKDVEAALAAENATVLKKLVLGYFPASCWTGKLRLFMQAQYGAAQDSDSWHFSPNVVGSDITLLYIRASEGDEVNTTITFGLWPHNSPGIFTSSDGRYWLLSVKMISYTITVDAYAILPEVDAVDDLIAMLSADPPPSAEDRKKIEAYIFAHSYIDVGSKRTIGSHTTTQGGEPISYGWKFNDDGSKASIVGHEQKGVFGDYHLLSTIIHLDFSYTPVDGQTPRPNWISFAATVESGGEWRDGWGAYNIFKPEYYFGGRLEAWAPSMAWFYSGGGRPNFSFSGIPVYGYYVDNVWKMVTMSRTFQEFGEGSEEYSEESTGLIFNASTPPASLAHQNRWQEGYRVSNQGFSAETHLVTEKNYMSIAFDGYSYSGTREYGAHNYVEGSIAETGYVAHSSAFIPTQLGTGPACDDPYSAPGFAEANTASYPSFTSYVDQIVGALTTTTRAVSGAIEKVWTMVIPMFDAESLYIVRAEHDTVDSETNSKTVQSNISIGFSAEDLDGLHHVVYPYSTMTFFGGVSVTTDEPAPDPPPWTSGIACFNQVVHGAAGTPAADITALFQVASVYPFYDLGMYTATSFNDRYWMTEGLRAPASVPNSPRFVGWA